MPKKYHKPEQIISKLRDADAMLSAGRRFWSVLPASVPCRTVLCGSDRMAKSDSFVMLPSHSNLPSITLLR